MSKSYTAESSPLTRRTLALFLLLGITLGVSGCRTTSDNQIDLLERELRVQEDYIYELEDYVVEYSEKLRTLRSCSPPQMAAYSQEVYEPAEAYEPEMESAPAYSSSRSKRSKKRHSKSGRSKNATQRQKIKQESVVEPEVEPLEEPAIEPPLQNQEPQSDASNDDLPVPSELPSDVSPEDLDAPESLDFQLDEPVGHLEETHLEKTELEETQPLQQVNIAEPDNGVLIIPDPVDFQPTPPADNLSADDQYADEDVFVDEQVVQSLALVERIAERLEVTQLFRGEGDDLSPQNGSPQNLLTVVEALDANGEPVDLDGKVSIMVMTADETAPKRLKRWNFTAEETIAAWQSSDLGDGLHLELPLEEIALPETPLELWVRLTMADGRKLLTQLPFEPSDLGNVSDEAPQPLPSGLALAETETSETETSESAPVPINLSQLETVSLPDDEKLDLAKILKPEAKQEPANQPRWRASMQRTDRTAEGFATTSSKTTGWTTQTIGRQANLPKQAATTQMSQPTSVQPLAPTQPTWTTGRTLLPR